MALKIADVSAEAILLAGGARALLLQIANPAVGHAVAEHSDFVNRPLDRLHGTLTYLYVIGFGTPEEVRRVARNVGQAHEPVRSAEYDARDPELQLWVAATIVDTARRVYELVHGPLDESEAQSLLESGATVATALGVPQSAWPATLAAFAAYWDAREAELRVDDTTRRVAGEVLHPRSGPWWVRAVMPTARVVTAGLLPSAIRDAYGLPHDEKRFRRLVRVARVVYPLLPRFVRHAPMRHYLAAFRRG